eukprot:g1232.t1
MRKLIPFLRYQREPFRNQRRKILLRAINDNRFRETRSSFAPVQNFGFSRPFVSNFEGGDDADNGETRKRRSRYRSKPGRYRRSRIGNKTEESLSSSSDLTSNDDNNDRASNSHSTSSNNNTSNISSSDPRRFGTSSNTDNFTTVGGSNSNNNNRGGGNRRSREYGTPESKALVERQPWHHDYEEDDEDQQNRNTDWQGGGSAYQFLHILGTVSLFIGVCAWIYGAREFSKRKNDKTIDYRTIGSMKNVKDTLDTEAVADIIKMFVYSTPSQDQDTHQNNNGDDRDAPLPSSSKDHQGTEEKISTSTETSIGRLEETKRGLQDSCCGICGEPQFDQNRGSTWNGGLGVEGKNSPRLLHGLLIHKRCAECSVDNCKVSSVRNGGVGIRQGFYQQGFGQTFERGNQSSSTTSSSWFGFGHSPNNTSSSSKELLKDDQIAVANIRKPHPTPFLSNNLLISEGQLICAKHYFENLLSMSRDGMIYCEHCGRGVTSLKEALDTLRITDAGQVICKHHFNNNNNPHASQKALQLCACCGLVAESSLDVSDENFGQQQYEQLTDGSGPREENFGSSERVSPHDVSKISHDGNKSSHDVSRIDDGRVLCSACTNDVINDEMSLKALTASVRKDLENVLHLKFSGDGSVVIKLANRDTPMFKRILSQFGSSPDGKTHVCIDGLTTMHDMALPKDQLTGRQARIKIVKEIYIREGLPRVYTAKVIAHEYFHAWLANHKFYDLPREIEEGLCELVSYLYLANLVTRQRAANGMSREKIENIIQSPQAFQDEDSTRSDSQKNAYNRETRRKDTDLALVNNAQVRDMFQTSMCLRNMELRALVANEAIANAKQRGQWTLRNEKGQNVQYQEQGIIIDPYASGLLRAVSILLSGKYTFGTLLAYVKKHKTWPPF